MQVYYAILPKVHWPQCKIQWGVGVNPLQGYKIPGKELGSRVAKRFMGIYDIDEDKYRLYPISFGVWEGGFATY